MPVTDLYILEDSEDVRSLLVEDLEDFYNITEFENPVPALAAIDQGDLPDLMLVDFKMPNMDGLEFLRELNSKDISIPAIIISGAVDKDVAVEALSLGVYSVLEKPINKTELIETCKKAVALSQSLIMVNEILEEFEAFTKSVKEWSKLSFDHIVKLENRLFEHKVPALSTADKGDDLKLRKAMRLTDQALCETEKAIATKLESYQQLKASAGL